MTIVWLPEGMVNRTGAFVAANSQSGKKSIASSIHQFRERREAVEKLMKDRTTFMIAHRLSTLKKCDIVLVMRDGRLNMITSDLGEAKLQLMQADAESVRPGIGPLGPVLIS